MFLKYENNKVSWFYLIVLHPVIIITLLHHYHYYYWIIITVVSLNFLKRNVVCKYKMSHYWEKSRFSCISLRGCLHGISFRAKWNIFISASVQFLIIVYMIQPEMKLIAGGISLQSFWKKWNFISGHKTPYKHYPKWNHMKRNICTCRNKIDWLFLNGVFILDHPRNELHFISPSIKSNVNRISFRVGWNFNSGRFHFGYLVNILYLINQKLHIILKILLNH